VFVCTIRAGKTELVSNAGGNTHRDTALQYPAEENSANNSGKNARGKFAGKHILLIDDVEINREIIIAMLEDTGIVIDCAANGAEAVDMFTRNSSSYDLLLMDLHMPVMDGFEAAKKLMEMGNKTPIVAMTANVMTHDTDLYAQYGMGAYIGKPFLARELWTCLLKFLSPLTVIPAEKSRELDESGASGGIDFVFDPDIINSAQGLKMSSGNSKLYLRLLNDFYKNNGNIIGELRGTAAAGDIERAHRMAHTLKNVAGLIGAVKVQKYAYEIEKALSNGRVEYREDQMGDLEKALKEALAALSDFREKSGGGFAKEPLLGNNSLGSSGEQQIGGQDTERILKLFDQLEPLLLEANPKSLGFLPELRDLLASLGTPAQTLTEQIDEYEFSAACQTMVEIKNQLMEEGNGNGR
jgi:CheY-like chemotaxis protein